VRPAGFAVVGTPRPKRSEYHYYAEDDGSQDGQRQRQLLSEARRAFRSARGQEPTRPRD
jgi:hypothetical protein